MALKDWKKLGEDHYKLIPQGKLDKLELYLSYPEKYEVVHRVGSKITIVAKKTRYPVLISYFGDGGNPDWKWFPSKSAAHKFIQKYIREHGY